MNKDFISIILPVYNAEKTIERTIKSIEIQSCDKYELIIVNDGSTDNTENICLKYSNNDKKIKYISIKNSGVSNARNVGIDNSSGKYICFIDADDEYNQDYIKKMIENVNQDDLIVCAYDRINEKNGSHRKIKLVNNIELKSFKEQIEILQSNLLFNQVWNKVYLSEIIKSNNIKFNHDISIGEDYVFNLEYVSYIKEIKYLDQILYYYYSQTTGLSLKDRDDKLKIKIYNWEKNKELYIKKGWDLEYLYRLYIKICLAGISKFVFKKDFKSNVEKNLNINYFKEIENNSKNRINRIIARIFNSNIVLTYILGILAKVYRKLYKISKVE